MTARALAIVLSLLLAPLAGPLEAGSMVVTIESRIKPKIDMEQFKTVLIGNFLAGLLNPEADEDDEDGADEEQAAASTGESGSASESESKATGATSKPKVERSAKQFYGSLDFAGETREYLMEELRNSTALNLVDVEPPELPAGSGDEVFEDAKLWTEMAANFEAPLIITGRVQVDARDVSGFVQETVRDRYYQDRELTVTRFRRRYAYTLALDLYFIDGMSGDQLYSEQLRAELTRSELDDLYPLSVFYDLMDELLPQFVTTLAPPRVELERYLLE